MKFLLLVQSRELALAPSVWCDEQEQSDVWDVSDEYHFMMFNFL